jgi:RNA polymerase sigma factor (TIGR02999 family)
MCYPLLAHNFMEGSLSLTEQLQRFSEGDREFAETVFSELFPKLHEIAVRELKRERFIAPVCPSELINEVWLRNLRKGGWQIQNREHFYAIASVAMRRVLVDLARNRLAQRRGSGDPPSSLEGIVNTGLSGPSAEQVVEIGLLMERLEQADPEAARVVDMHHFVGFTLEEIAGITGLSFRQIRSRWEKGRDWLKDRLDS